MSYQEKNDWPIRIDPSPESRTSISPSNLSCLGKYALELAGSPSGQPASLRAGDISQCQDLTHRMRMDGVAPVKSEKVLNKSEHQCQWIIESHTLLNLLIDSKCVASEAGDRSQFIIGYAHFLLGGRVEKNDDREGKFGNRTSSISCVANRAANRAIFPAPGWDADAFHVKRQTSCFFYMGFKQLGQ